MKKIIPLKNYFILSVIIIATIALTFYFASWYRVYKENNNSQSIIAEILFNIEPSNLNDYLIENPNTIIYTLSNLSSDTKKFEKELKKIIIDNQITETILFMNIENKTDEELAKIKNKLSKNLIGQEIFLNSYNNLLLVENGIIKEILYYEVTSPKIKDFKDFLTQHKIITNN